jgi:hypothetical protein
LNQKSEAVALGYYCLANVYSKENVGGFETKNLAKGEKLVRESLHIRVLLYGNNDYTTGYSIALLASLLNAQGKLGDETKELYERSLALHVRNQGPDGLNTSMGNGNLGNYHYQLFTKKVTLKDMRKQLLLARGYYTEVVRICTKIFGGTHPKSMMFVQRLEGLSHDRDMKKQTIAITTVVDFKSDVMI